MRYAMLIVVIVLGFVAIGISIYVLLRQVRTLRHDLNQLAKQQLATVNGPSPGHNKNRHLRLVKGMVIGAGISSAVQWVRAHPGPAISLASSAAAIAVLVPAAVPDDAIPLLPDRPRGGTAEPLTSPPIPSGEIPPPPDTAPRSPTDVEPPPAGEPQVGLPSRALASRAPTRSRPTPPPGPITPPSPPPGTEPPGGGDDPPANNKPDQHGLCLRLDLQPLAEVGACVGELFD